jgi:PAS domain S-box-containing protein
MFLGLFEAVPEALLIVDGDGRIVQANHHAERLFGYPSRGLAGIVVERLVPAEARARHRAHRNDYVASPRVRPMGATDYTLVGQRRDGTQFPVEIALSPIESTEGTRFLASVRDISETQRARQSLVRARYDALVARMGQLALEADDEADVVDQAPSLLADVLGIETVVIAFVSQDRQSMEIRAATGFATDASGIAPNGKSLTQALATRRPWVVEDFSQPSPYKAAFPIVANPTGSAAMVPLFDRSHAMGALIVASGEPRRFDHDAMHLLQSVANLIAALVQRRRTEEQLAHSQRLEAIGQLTGGIAHDFNNLLTVVSGSLQLLETEYLDKPEAGEVIESALRSVTRGAELTNKLLAFARRQRLMPQSVDPRALLRDVELMLKRTLGDSIRLQVHCEQDLPPAYVDPTQLDTALVNLALNARDAMPRGGEISIEAREYPVDAEQATPDLPVGRYVLISVADTGRGMTRETLARAMEPFFTTKGAGHGSGLGLSMVYGFAKQSGGHLLMESALGYGTRVEMYLPAARSAPAPVAASTAPMAGGAGETILVVEDDAAVRNIAVAFLRATGYRTHAVASAGEALRKLQEDRSIALLFSDVMLGSGGNGKELARAARELNPGLAVLLTSGYEQTDVSQTSDADGVAFALLHKPYRREQLLAAVRRALHSHRPPPTR